MGRYYSTTYSQIAPIACQLFNSEAPVAVWMPQRAKGCSQERGREREREQMVALEQCHRYSASTDRMYHQRTLAEGKVDVEPVIELEVMF